MTGPPLYLQCQGLLCIVGLMVGGSEALPSYTHASFHTRR